MTSSSFPTQLSQIQLANSTHEFYSSIKELRKSTLSIPNRIHSILSDSNFVLSVAEHFDLPLIANERCGSWYIDPANKVGSTYFKSTDGHHGQWDFSLRRLNLQLLQVLGKEGGAVVVDSTRRGKNIPDAFSKTVPIWVAVMNRVLFPDAEWSHKLQAVPAPNQLGESESSQIEKRLDGFAESFKQLGIDLPELRKQAKKPIRILCAINGMFDPHSTSANINDDYVNGDSERFRHGYHLLVLCSASRRIHGSEMSAGGYIQGAGDDSEGWSHGLSPNLFWNHKDELLSTPETDLSDLIQKLIKHEGESQKMESIPVLIKPTQNIYIRQGPQSLPDDFKLVINCNGTSNSLSHQILDLECSTGKIGSDELRKKMHMAKSFVMTTIEREPNCKILITCATGNDLSAGVAVMILCLFYNDSGQLKTWPNNRKIDKQYIKQRLAWISSSKPEANPSRSTLQAVNSFLMERPTDNIPPN